MSFLYMSSDEFNMYNVGFGYLASSSELGGAIAATWGNESSNVQQTLNEYKLGVELQGLLSSGNYSSNVTSSLALVNSVTSSSSGSHSVSVGSDGAINITVGGGSSSGATVVSGGSSSGTGSTDQSKFDKKVKLIKKYDKLNSCNHDSEVAKIKEEVGTDYAKGIEKLDALMKSFNNKAGLKAAANALFKEDTETKMKSAKGIADKWKETIDNGSTGNFQVDFSGVTADNILDVLGAYVSETDFKTTQWWVPLIHANSDKIVSLLKEKASSLKTQMTEKNISTPSSDSITSAISELDAALNKDTPIWDTISNKVAALADVMRQAEAEVNDAQAEIDYGVPESEVEEDQSDVSKEEYEAEKQKYEAGYDNNIITPGTNRLDLVA